MRWCVEPVPSAAVAGVAVMLLESRGAAVTQSPLSCLFTLFISFSDRSCYVTQAGPELAVLCLGLPSSWVKGVCCCLRGWAWRF